MTQSSIVFSVRQWSGDFTSKTLEHGVKTSSFQSSLYRIHSDGTGLVQIVKPTDGVPWYRRFFQKKLDNNWPVAHGDWIYFHSNRSGSYQIYRTSSDGSQTTLLTAAQKIAPWKEATCPKFEHTGRRLTFTVSDEITSRVAVADSNFDKIDIVEPTGHYYMSTPSPIGDRVIISGPESGYRLRWVDPTLKTNVDVAPKYPSSYMPQFSPDGKSVYFVREDGDLYRLKLGTVFDVKRLTRGNRYVEFKLSESDAHGTTDFPDISPDGDELAYISRQDGVPNVYVMKSDGSAARQITFRKTPCARVRWSPDGKQIAFVSFEGKWTQLFVVTLNGGEPKQLTHLDGAVFFLNWK